LAARASAVSRLVKLLNEITQSSSDLIHLSRITVWLRAEQSLFVRAARNKSSAWRQREMDGEAHSQTVFASTCGLHIFSPENITSAN
jgi:hypothetical protein